MKLFFSNFANVNFVGCFFGAVQVIPVCVVA